MFEGAVDEGGGDGGVEKLVVGDVEDVTVEDGEVGEFAGGDGAEAGFLITSNGGSHRESVERFMECQLLLRMPAFGVW